jgi:hypothetical protein
MIIFQSRDREAGLWKRGAGWERYPICSQAWAEQRAIEVDALIGRREENAATIAYVWEAGFFSLPHALWTHRPGEVVIGGVNTHVPI